MLPLHPIEKPLMKLSIPLSQDLADPPYLHDLKVAFARKGERVLVDPIYRSSLPADWWAHDRRTIDQEAERLIRDGRLDRWKTSVDFPHEDTYDQRFRFRRWVLERSFWIQHLPEVESSDVRLDRWFACGSDAHVWKDPTDNSYVLRSETCKLRICPACRRRYQFAAIARIRDLLSELKPRQWQFITLTIRHTQAPLKIQTDFLKACFRRLRQRKIWKQSVSHGYAVLEISYNKQRDEWHPHLHILARCPWIDWRRLRDAWISVTNGSSVIDCGYVRNSPNACDYVAKYLGKPPNLLDIERTERLDEYYNAIQNSRFLMPFGKPPKMSTTRTLHAPRSLIPFASLSSLHIQARQGNLDSAKILRALNQQNDARCRQTDPEHRHAITASATDFDPTDPLVRSPPT
jgi:hypothetical protein